MTMINGTSVVMASMASAISRSIRSRVAPPAVVAASLTPVPQDRPGTAVPKPRRRRTTTKARHDAIRPRATTEPRQGVQDREVSFTRTDAGPGTGLGRILIP